MSVWSPVFVPLRLVAAIAPSIVKVPSTLTTPLELTFNIGTPDISDTENISPTRESVIANNWPCVPCISKTVSPAVFPFNSNVAPGLVVPIPTSPSAVITILAVAAVDNVIPATPAVLVPWRSILDSYAALPNPALNTKLPTPAVFAVVIV